MRTKNNLMVAPFFLSELCLPKATFASLLLITLLLSCVGLGTSNDQTQLIPLDVGGKPTRQFKHNFTTKDIDYAIVNEDFSKAATILSQLQNLSTAKEQKYLRVIQEGIGDILLETLETGDALEALPYYYSLQSLGIAEKYISSSDFISHLFDFYIRKRYFGAALSFAHSNLENGFQLNSSVKNKLQRFIQEQYQRNPVAYDGQFWEQRINGTVTIFVEMGTERMPYTNLYLPATEIGSGFFIDNSGSIVTNYHVISSHANKYRVNSNNRIYVKLSSRDEMIPAKLMGWDPNRDLALLRISRQAPYLLRMNSTFSLLQYNNPEKKLNPALAIGNKLYAIGAPGGLENTLTSGLVSARGRKILPLSNALQIDVPANPGNSGGPLLNSRGIVEGVVFAKNNSGFEGIAFAIPSDTLSSVLPRLYLGGKVKNSWLGLLVDEYSTDEDYLKIRYVFPDSPAAAAGLRSGLRILSYRNNTYSQTKTLQSQISMAPTGSIISLEVQDPEGQISEHFLELGERPDKPMYRNLGQESSSELFYALFGAQLAPESRYRSYEITQTLPHSQVSKLNLHQGDYIQIIKWLTDTDNNIVIAHISYRYQDSLTRQSKESVLIQQIDLPNIL